jgi:sugar phosphate isomerase/epimerase
MEGGVGAGFQLLRDRVVTVHLHDNHGEKDEHLLPWEGTIDWDAAIAEFANLSDPLPLVLELKETASGAPSLDQIREALDQLEEKLDAKGARSARTRPART